MEFKFHSFALNERAGLLECDICGAIVLPVSAEKHAAFHASAPRVVGARCPECQSDCSVRSLSLTSGDVCRNEFHSDD